MGQSMINKEAIYNLKNIIKNLYLSDDLPWVIGYSGGKDSTATLQLVWMAISDLPYEQRNKTVHVINTDTLVESPVVSKWVNSSLELMKEAIKKDNLPVNVHQLTPNFEDSFWVNFLGKGYPAPRRNMRWCTDRLKIKPVNTFIKQKIAEHGEIIMILGTRKAESTNRARSMENLEKQRVRELLSPNPTLKNEYVFSPLEDWSNDDVWAFLLQFKNPWGRKNTDLLTLYRGATEDGECPIIQDKNTPSCGNSRFGCWVCTVVSKDKSMEAMIGNGNSHNDWMRPMVDLRNEFEKSKDEREKRSFRKMAGYLQGSYGHLNHGPYLKQFREEWLKKLLTIQKSIRDEAPEEFRSTILISQQELEAIRRIWVLEKHEFDDSLPRIYKEVFGEDFIDPTWVFSDSFGKEEWDLLKECCQDLYPDETLLFELMYSALDLERYSEKTGNRKGLRDNLKTLISSSFYKDENDALSYYTNINVERREYGLEYASRFFETYDNPRYQQDNDDSFLEDSE